MKAWAHVKAEVLLAELRGKPAKEVTRLLAKALEQAAGSAGEALREAERTIEELMSMEPADRSPGAWLESQIDGFCKDCAIPFAVGTVVWWNGPGKGALCIGCRKAEEWKKE